MAHQLDVIIERDEEGFYVASVPQLPGCHTQARSLDEVKQRVREAIELYLDGGWSGSTLPLPHGRGSEAVSLFRA